MKKVKGFFVLLMSVLVALAFFTPVLADDIGVQIDGVPIAFADQGPAIVNNRTLVPVRDVFEAIGFIVGWNEDTRTVSLSSDSYEILLVIDSDDFTVNGEVLNLDVPAQIIGERTLLPIRAILEAVGYSVAWDSSTVIISSQAPEAAVSQDVTPPVDATQAIVDYLTGQGYAFLPTVSFPNHLDIVSADEFYEIFDWPVEPDYYPIPTSLQLPDSVVGMILADFDGDGTEEMLVICSHWQAGPVDGWADRWNVGTNVLSMQMLRVENGSVTVSARTDLGIQLNPGYTSFLGVVDVFAKTLDDGIVIGVQENTYTGGVWANSMDVVLNAYRYLGGEFENTLHLGHLDFIPETGEDIDAEMMEQMIRDAGFSTISNHRERAIDAEPHITRITTLEHGPSVSLEEFIEEIQSLIGENRDLGPISLHITNTVPDIREDAVAITEDDAVAEVSITGEFTLVRTEYTSGNIMEEPTVLVESLIIRADGTFEMVFEDGSRIDDESFSRGIVQAADDNGMSYRGVGGVTWDYYLFDDQPREGPSFLIFGVTALEDGLISVLWVSQGFDESAWLNWMEEAPVWIMARGQ